MTGAGEALLAVLARLAPEIAALGASAEGARERFLIAFAAAARRLGGTSIALDDGARAALVAAGVAPPIADPRRDELGRIAMLIGAAERLGADALAGLVDECYRHGELRERVAVLRALPFLPAPERLLSVAVDACRTHVQPVFEAIACENPYPAAHFPPASFNQMVLKALFTGMPLARIAGLDARRTPELARMAAAFASERRAAGRAVPADVARVAPEESR